MRKLIINADDFGHDSSVNGAICESFARGCISQTTLMTNMPGADEAVSLAHDCGFADKVGLHLNLTEGFPLTDPIRRFKRFCNKDGSFTRQHPFIGLPYMGEERMVLMSELLAQIERYLSFQLPLMHCDGHHHIQSRLPLAALIFPLLKRCGFKSFRNCYPYPKYDINRRFLRMSRYTPLYYGMRLIKGCLNLSCADYFMDFKMFGRVQSEIPDGIFSELMVHPRYAEDRSLVDFHGSMNEVKRTISDSGFSLATYKEVQI